MSVSSKMAAACSFSNFINGDYHNLQESDVDYDKYAHNLDSFLNATRSACGEEYHDKTQRGEKRKWIVEQEKEVDEFLTVHCDCMPENYKDSSIFTILGKNDMLKNILLDYKNYIENIEDWQDFSAYKRPRIDNSSRVLIPGIVNRVLMETNHEDLDRSLCAAEEGDEFIMDHLVYETQNLYACHMIREMQRKGLVAPTNTFDMRVPPPVLSKFVVLIERFKKTKARKQVFMKAESVELKTLDYTSFHNLLQGLFRNGGVTWERIMVLFFFCADVSIRAVREHVGQLFYAIFRWTISCLTSLLCNFVQSNGGWDSIFTIATRNNHNYVLYSSCALGVGLLAYYFASSRYKF